MKEQMEAPEGELKEAQASESAKAGAEMRSAKQAAIEAGEKMAEQKEDTLAKTDKDQDGDGDSPWGSASPWIWQGQGG